MRNKIEDKMLLYNFNFRRLVIFLLIIMGIGFVFDSWANNFSKDRMVFDSYVFVFLFVVVLLLSYLILRGKRLEISLEGINFGRKYVGPLKKEPREILIEKNKPNLKIDWSSINSILVKSRHPILAINAPSSVLLIIKTKKGEYYAQETTSGRLANLEKQLKEYNKLSLLKHI